MNIQPHAWHSRLLIPLFSGGLALVAVILLLDRAFGQNNVRVAQPAPLFVMKEAQGKTIKLTDFKNKALIICFLATWDEPSRKQMGILNDMVGQYGETNLAVLALALDETGPGSLTTYAEQHHLRYALHVADYDVIQTFGGLTSIPVTIVIDKNQNVIDKYVGVTETNVLDADVRAILKQ
ncbi:MAG: peroxiredoxin family protein [Verrucomicrobiia bacterium]